MPINPTYPGVYVQEIPSGVRTIVGVPTSITAFVGRTKKGDVNEPTDCSNWGEFDRKFGGLWDESPMTYAVRDFFLNGGSQAKIVRVTSSDTAAAVAETGDLDGVNFVARSAGAWGNSVRAQITYPDPQDAIQLQDKYNLGSDTSEEEIFFNLSIFDDEIDKAVPVEVFNGLTFRESPRRIDAVLQGSQYVEAQDWTAGADRPDEMANPAALEGGDDGGPLDMGADIGDGSGSNQADKTGMYALEKADIFNILCIPEDQFDGDTPEGVYQAAMNYCASRRAMLIVDPPAAWGDAGAGAVNAAVDGLANDLGLTGTNARNAALFFPRVKQRDPLEEDAIGRFVPCGLVAGAMAKTDANRGIWKAAAGINASLTGVESIELNLTDDENGILNPLGINCLRSFPVFGNVIWGARTLRGADVLADEYKYVPIRRTALYIEESLYRGLKWVVFEPNDEPLWAQVRQAGRAFMHGMFRQGAFEGKTPKEAYFVKCDGETTPIEDRRRGIVNIYVGFAPLYPAEFVMLYLQQKTAEADA
jgi:phage tail sheath protein FI